MCRDWSDRDCHLCCVASSLVCSLLFFFAARLNIFMWLLLCEGTVLNQSSSIVLNLAYCGWILVAWQPFHIPRLLSRHNHPSSVSSSHCSLDLLLFVVVVVVCFDLLSLSLLYFCISLELHWLDECLSRSGLCMVYDILIAYLLVWNVYESFGIWRVGVPHTKTAINVLIYSFDWIELKLDWNREENKLRSQTIADSIRSISLRNCSHNTQKKKHSERNPRTNPKR